MANKNKNTAVESDFFGLKSLLRQGKQAERAVANKNKNAACFGEFSRIKVEPQKAKQVKVKAVKQQTAAKESKVKEVAPTAHHDIKATKIQPKNESENKAYELAKHICKLLSEKKARDITIIDVSERTVVADYFIVAGAGSSTQVRALVDYVDEKLSKERSIEPLHRDKNTQWYAVDYGSIILHVMTAATREIYSLERLWSDGTNVESVN